MTAHILLGVALQAMAASAVGARVRTYVLDSNGYESEAMLATDNGSNRLAVPWHFIHGMQRTILGHELESADKIRPARYRRIGIGFWMGAQSVTVHFPALGLCQLRREAHAELLWREFAATARANLAVADASTADTSASASASAGDIAAAAAAAMHSCPRANRYGDMSGLTLQQQANAMRHARLAGSFEGSGFVNMLFMPPGGAVLIFDTAQRGFVDWEQYIQDGGATANQGGWWVHKPPGRIALVGSGTCGPFCNIAKSVALYLAGHFGPALDHLAVVDVGAGVGSFAACLSSMHGVGTTMSVSPLEPGQNEHGGQEAGQTFLAAQRGVPLLIDYASSDRQLPLQSASVHAVFSCYGAGGAFKSHHWFWYEVSRLLKPGGFLILEGHIRSHTSNPVPKNLTQFCMVPAPAPLTYENRWFNGKWMRDRLILTR
eukprot:jgi/Chrpa1/16293/Chrysochromulina_OHIO_Genome00006646-RA